MKKRISVLLAASMIVGGTSVTAFANTNESVLKDVLRVEGQTARTTTSGGIEITTPPTLGITSKVITTDKGTITILDDGSIEVGGDTKYNPLTGNFDVKNHEYETILTDKYLGKIKYGYGATFKRDYTFVMRGKAYGVEKGTIYTRWYAKDDFVNWLNILPIFSFLQIDNEWVYASTDAILYPRYKNTREVNEIVSLDSSTLRLEEETLLRDEEEDLILPSGTLAIIVDGRANNIRDSFPPNTIINYPNGEVRYLGKKMKIVNTNLSVGIQNMNGDNKSAEFRSYILNQEEEVKPPVDENNGNGNEVKPPITETEEDDYEWTPQNLNKSKQYDFEVINDIIIMKNGKSIKLEKGDKIILPKSTTSILKELPQNTLILKKNGKRVVLEKGYFLNNKVEFKETKELYIAYKLKIYNKTLDIVFKLR